MRFYSAPHRKVTVSQSPTIDEESCACDLSSCRAYQTYSVYRSVVWEFFYNPRLYICSCTVDNDLYTELTLDTVTVFLGAGEANQRFISASLDYSPCSTLRLKVKGRDIYIQPLTGKP